MKNDDRENVGWVVVLALGILTPPVPVRVLVLGRSSSDSGSGF